MNIEPMKIAFFDTETTHLSHVAGEIIEWALIIVFQNKIFKKIERKVKPNHIETAHYKALEINGYNEKDWENAMPSKQAAQELADLLDGCLLVAHNAPFDIRHAQQFFLENEIQFDISSLPYIDTKVLAKNVYKDIFSSFSLDKIRVQLGWDLEGSHRALKDAEDCCRLFYLCVQAPCPLDTPEEITFEMT